jgi:hypothetical protein
MEPGFSRKVFWTLEIPFKTSFTVLKLILERWDGVVWTGLIWLKIRTGGGIL